MKNQIASTTALSVALLAWSATNASSQIATVQAGNGYCADGHEFQSTADLTSIGGPSNQTSTDSKLP